MYFLITFLIGLFIALSFRYVKKEERILEYNIIHDFWVQIEKNPNVMESFISLAEENYPAFIDFISGLPISRQGKKELKAMIRAVLDEKAEKPNQNELLEKTSWIVPFN